MTRSKLATLVVDSQNVLRGRDDEIEQSIIDALTTGYKHLYPGPADATSQQSLDADVAEVYDKKGLGETG